MNHSQLERICLKLKGTTTDIKWGNDLCYLVGGKMYCVAALEAPMKVSLKVTAEEFGDLIERNGIIPAPYMARNKWIFVETPGALSPAEWTHFIRQSYELVLSRLPKKVKDQFKVELAWWDVLDSNQ